VQGKNKGFGNFFDFAYVCKGSNKTRKDCVMSTQNDNNGLYFIVGALVVIVALMGFLYLGNSDDGDVLNIEPAAGIEETVDETSSSFELNIDDEGVSGTTTQSTSE